MLFLHPKREAFNNVGANDSTLILQIVPLHPELAQGDAELCPLAASTGQEPVQS